MSRVIAAFTQFFKGDGSPLANGYLRFLISQTTSTDKATYADVNQTIPNANPVQLDGEGRCPNVFGQGIYKVVLYDINPVTGLPGMMVQTFDPVVADYQSEGAGGNFAEWESGTIYQIGQIVIYNGLYYRSHIANNVGNQPDISADSWERIDFLRFWNLDVTYGLDDVVIYGSQLYFSLQAGNLNHVPSTSPAWWDPVGSGTVLLNWQESGTAFIPVSAGYDLGSAANFIGDFYQGDNSIHYFGTGQDASLYFDSTDLYLNIGANAWALLAAGHIEPQTDATFYFGGASNRIKQIYVSDAPVDDNNVVRLTDLTEINLGGRKNLVDNGNLKIWQRGTASIALDGNLLADRFKGSVLAWTSATQQQANLSLSEIEITDGLEYALRIDTSGGPTATDAYATLFYHDFNFYQYADKTITFSIYAKTGSGDLEIGVRLLQIFGSGGSASVATSPQNITINGTLDRYDLQFTMPSIVGKTIGTDPYIRCDITIAAAGTYLTSSGSANQDGTFYITGIQIEENFFATFFEYRSKQNTLLDCLPYCRLIGQGLVGAWANATTAEMSAQYGVPMRISPQASLTTTTINISEIGATSLAIQNTTTATLVTYLGNIEGSYSVQINGFTGATQGATAILRTPNAILLDTGY